LFAEIVHTISGMIREHAILAPDVSSAFQFFLLN